ncbi:restriction endonuclease subunit S [Herminiimonas glaciei]|uniref:Restriction endonuclease subunit S n=1 Tax=Herminiimonas glaciei TaxID=523788 RepID=A0ABW2IFN4_9BURK
MKFKPYPKYKASGVEWLGDVPHAWEIVPFKREIERNDGGAWGDEPDAETGTLTVVLRSTEQTADGQWNINDPAMRKLSNTELAGSLLAEGDLVVTKSSGSSLHIGKTTLVSADVAKLGCCYSNFMQRIRLRRSSVPKFVWYVMNNDISRSQFDLLSNSTTGLANLNSTMIGELKLSIPPVEEQSTIATFLDLETAKIDTLIAKQEKLIDLLKEKRQAVISHAVTKGLDPTVPMKPSGVEWLGDVPEHWIHRRIRFCASLNPSKSEISHLARNYEVSFLPMEAIGDDGKLRLDITKAISDVEYGYTYFRNGDITIAKITPCYENGKGGFMDGLTNGIGFGTTELIVVRPNSQTNGLFLKWLFESKLFRKIGEGYMYGAGGQKRVPDDFVRNFAISWPPLTEQQEIVAYLDKVTAKIDILIAKAQQAIALQKEHRTALISAAVTGKIDVRNIACKAVDKRSTQKFNKVQHANI